MNDISKDTMDEEGKKKKQKKRTTSNILNEVNKSIGSPMIPVKQIDEDVLIE